MHPTKSTADTPMAMQADAACRDNVHARRNQLRDVIDLLESSATTMSASEAKRLQARAAELLRPLVAAIVARGDLELMRMILTQTDRGYDEVTEALNTLSVLLHAETLPELVRPIRELTRSPAT